MASLIMISIITYIFAWTCARAHTHTTGAVLPPSNIGAGAY